MSRWFYFKFTKIGTRVDEIKKVKIVLRDFKIEGLLSQYRKFVHWCASHGRVSHFVSWKQKQGYTIFEV